MEYWCTIWIKVFATKWFFFDQVFLHENSIFDFKRSRNVPSTTFNVFWCSICSIYLLKLKWFNQLQKGASNKGLVEMFSFFSQFLSVYVWYTAPAYTFLFMCAQHNEKHLSHCPNTNNADSIWTLNFQSYILELQKQKTETQKKSNGIINMFHI